MLKKLPNVLNDQIRMEAWQSAMPAFENWEDEGLQNDQIRDYLSCYGLDCCAEQSGIRYQAGYREIAGEQIFHQLFEIKQAEVVLIVHGYTDHAGLFSKVIKYLLDKGFSVCIFDFPGHGLSSGERATITSFDNYRLVLDDSFRFFQQSLAQPLHIVGQSLGGAMTMHWLIANSGKDTQIGKVVLLAPLVRPKAWRRVSWTYRFLSMTVDSIPRGESQNSEDAAFTRFVRFEDPVQHDRLPAQWVGAMLQWVKEFEAMEGSDIALTVIQGDQDETVDWQYNAPHIQMKFPNTILNMVVGAGHHLAGESDRLQEYIFAYMDQGLGK